MTIYENYSLRNLNTFGFEVRAARFGEIHSSEEITSFLEKYYRQGDPLLILGGGSNLLFTRDFPGMVLRISLGGIRLVEEGEKEVVISAGAGVVWDDFVAYCVSNGWGGLENLSLIPGLVGSTPIQNIGAYGMEVGETIREVHYTEVETGQQRVISGTQCRFGYRNSIFKHELKEKIMVTEVIFSLASEKVTAAREGLKLDYGHIRKELEIMGVSDPSIREVREAVCRIRRSKLPDPAVTGNAGSFFKNPVVPAEKADALRSHYDCMPSFADPNGIKIPAAWLIEQCGWKGKRFGDAGVHINQPLVLVNYGHATGQQILHLSEQIRNSVLDKFGITIESEVVIV